MGTVFSPGVDRRCASFISFGARPDSRPRPGSPYERDSAAKNAANIRQQPFDVRGRAAMKNLYSANTATDAAAVAPRPPAQRGNAAAARGMANGASDRVGAAAARTIGWCSTAALFAAACVYTVSSGILDYVLSALTATHATMAAAVKKKGGFCSQIWNSTLNSAAFWAFAARTTATRCSGEWSGLLGAASSLGEDNSWRSLGAAAASACVWAFFCAVAALLLLAAALNNFRSSARCAAWRKCVALLALPGLAAARLGSANASVAPFSERFAQARRKLTMTDSNIGDAVVAWLSGDTTTYGHISTWDTFRCPAR